MRTTLKRVLGVVLALCVLVAGATCLMGISVFAEDELINVARDSLAGMTTYAQYSTRVLFSKENNTSQGCAYMVFDGVASSDNGKKWFPNTAANEWIILDLGKFYDISQINIQVMSSRYIKYNIYTAATIGGNAYTADNKLNVYNYLKQNGTVVANRSANSTQTKTTDTFTKTTARYVLLDVASSGNGNICVEEMEIMGVAFNPDNETSTNNGAPTVDTNIAYSYISGLDNTVKAQKVLASAVAGGTSAYGYKAFDGVVANNNNTNQWYPGNPPAYLVIDLGDVYNLSAITVHFRKESSSRTSEFCKYD